MSSNLNITLNGAVYQVITNTDSATRVNTSLGNPTLAGTASTYYDFFPVGNGAGTGVTIPSGITYIIYIKNLGGVNSSPSGNITVQATPAGGTTPGTTACPVIPPGGVYIYHCTSESAGGVTGLTLIASVNNTPCEILLAY